MTRNSDETSDISFRQNSAVGYTKLL